MAYRIKLWLPDQWRRKMAQLGGATLAWAGTCQKDLMQQFPKATHARRILGMPPRKSLKLSTHSGQFWNGFNKYKSTLQVLAS